MLYPELFASLEKARWNMADDIAWDRFDASLLSDEQAQTIKMNAIPSGRLCRQQRCSCATIRMTVIFLHSCQFGFTKNRNML